MYPDKIKRLVLDGVIDGHSYRLAGYETDIVDVQAIADSLFTYCFAAGPGRCAIYDATPEKIRERFYSVLDAVEREPVSVPLANPPLVITRKAIAEQLFSAVYRPVSTFPAVADTIRAIETRNATALTIFAPKIVNPTE